MSGFIINPYVFASDPLEFIAANPWVWTTQSYDLSLPEDAQEGDFVVVVTSSHSDGSTIGFDDFTKFNEAHKSGDSRQIIWTRWLTGSEPATYNLTDVANFGKTCVVLVYRGVNTTTPISPILSSITPNREFKSIDIEEAGDFLLCIGSYRAGTALGALSGMTIRATAVFSTLQRLTVYEEEMASAGATGLRNPSGTNRGGVWTSLGLRQA